VAVSSVTATMSQVDMPSVGESASQEFPFEPEVPSQSQVDSISAINHFLLPDVDGETPSKRIIIPSDPKLQELLHYIIAVVDKIEHNELLGVCEEHAAYLYMHVLPLLYAIPPFLEIETINPNCMECVERFEPFAPFFRVPATVMLKKDMRGFVLTRISFREPIDSTYVERIELCRPGVLYMPLPSRHICVDYFAKRATHYMTPHFTADKVYEKSGCTLSKKICLVKTFTK
jgi:hypothetical protein